MKFHKKYLNLKYWLDFLRRQPNHLQHMYAVIFAGTITAMIAMGILYFDYGFWREKYSRTDTIATTTIKNLPEEEETISPGEMFGNVFKEATVRVQEIKNQKIDLLEGKEVYVNESTSTKRSNADSVIPTRNEPSQVDQ